jgi:hypothetical protein
MTHKPHKSRHLNVKVSDAEMAELDRLATAAGLTKSAYVLAQALGGSATLAPSADQRMADIERRLTRLENR